MFRNSGYKKTHTSSNNNFIIFVLLHESGFVHAVQAFGPQILPEKKFRFSELFLSVYKNPFLQTDQPEVSAEQIAVIVADQRKGELRGIL